MDTIRLRPAEPKRDFGQLAAFFTILEDWPSTEQGLNEFYERSVSVRFMLWLRMRPASCWASTGRSATRSCRGALLLSVREA